MAIYTQFGTSVTILDAHLDDNDQLIVKVATTTLGRYRVGEYHVSHLKADNGFEEIMSNPLVARLFNSQNS